MRCVERPRTDAVGSLGVCLLITTICVNFSIHYKEKKAGVLSCVRDPVYVQTFNICSRDWKCAHSPLNTVRDSNGQITVLFISL